MMAKDPAERYQTPAEVAEAIKSLTVKKTDVADTIPEATKIVPTCHIEGNGTAWFDDLEVVAYDRDKLPADFDRRHGKHNRLTGSLDFDRWVGRWATTTEYKPTVTAKGKTITGEAIVRKVLDDRFLLWQWASESRDSQSERGYPGSQIPQKQKNLPSQFPDTLSPRSRASEAKETYMV